MAELVSCRKVIDSGFSIATPERKKAPNWLIVEEAIADDNSMVWMHPYTMFNLKFVHGDTILIKGNERKDTLCIAIADYMSDKPRIRMNKVVRSNLRVKIGDVVSVHQCPDVKYAKRVDILLVKDTTKGITFDLFDGYLKPYFLENYRPVRKGDVFLVRGRGFGSVEIKVIETDPAEFCVVAPDTEIYFEGKKTEKGARMVQSCPTRLLSENVQSIRWLFQTMQSLKWERKKK